MEKMHYSFDETNSSSALVRGLINEQKNLEQLTNKFFSVEALLAQCNRKLFTNTQRQVLVSALKAQNKDVELSALTTNNIHQLLDDNTYTITTGHQLNMASGPLYTLYKIIEVINWCEKLNEIESGKNFVPVFWMATEDHDFEEINHINLFGSKIGWQHQSADNSIVGRISTEPAVDFVSQVSDKFRDEDLKSKVADFLRPYQNGVTLAMANRELINNLFGKYGLVIIDGDDKDLKKAFKNIAQKEIKSGVTFKSVSKTNKLLDDLGFHKQVFLRESNLFYIEPNGERVRIEKNGNEFVIKQQNYNVAEMLELLEKYPERFSPNALLRPAYQESILPNIAYVGGGGEIAYWLQIKTTFENLDIEFPLLKVRESVLLIVSKMREAMQTYKYSPLDLKKELDLILKDFVKDNQTIEISLEQQKISLDKIKSDVLQKALAIDKNATTFIEAEFQRMENQLDKMEKKFIASEKKNQEKAIKQIENLQNRMYPNGGFQERYDNYLSYLHYPNFIDDLKTELKQRMTAMATIQVINI